MTSLTKISYFHHVFMTACNYSGCFHWHFPLQLVPHPNPPESHVLRQSLMGFTASGKMYFVISEWKKFSHQLFIYSWT